MKRESGFQAALIRTLHNLFEGCIVLKLDAKYMQGIPDLIILYGPFWAMLECKKSENESKRPNQEYYVNLINNEMAYASFVYPENVQQVLGELEEYFNNMGQILIDNPNIILKESFSNGVFINNMMSQHPYQVAVA